MKNKLVASLIIVCATFAPSGVGSAQRRDTVTLFGPTGSQLLEICSEPPLEVGATVPAERLVSGARNNGLCAGFIAGVNDEALQASSLAHTFCVPDGVQLDQLAKVVRKYLEDNPAKLHLPGSILVESALDQAFPCR